MYFTCIDVDAHHGRSPGRVGLGPSERVAAMLSILNGQLPCPSRPLSPSHPHFDCHQV